MDTPLRWLCCSYRFRRPPSNQIFQVIKKNYENTVRSWESASSVLDFILVTKSNWFVLLRYFIGLKISRHFFIQSELKPHQSFFVLTQLLRVLIGSQYFLVCLCLLWLTRVVSLVLVLRHQIENRSNSKFIKGFQWTRLFFWAKSKLQGRVGQGPIKLLKMNFDFNFLALWRGFLFVLFVSQFWVWIILNYSKLKQWKCNVKYMLKGIVNYEKLLLLII